MLKEVIEAAGFTPNIVSDANDSGLIHKRILENLYRYPLVVCDVSAKNPNVMFELGIRLTFDKPTVIVKDDKTDYSFDTAGIEHIGYPRDMRYKAIQLFKEKLILKLQATHEKATTDPNYSTFLKHFGTFQVPSVAQKEVPALDFLQGELQGIREELGALSGRWIPKSSRARTIRNLLALEDQQIETLSEFEKLKHAITTAPIRAAISSLPPDSKKKE